SSSHIDCHRFIPLSLGYFRYGRGRSNDAGVVDENVDLAKSADCCLDHCVDLIFMGHIARHGQPLPLKFPNVGSSLFEPFQIASADQNVRTLASERQCDCSTD